MFEDMEADDIVERFIFERELVGIRDDQRAIDPQVAATLGVIFDEAIDEDIGARIRSITAPDLQDQLIVTDLSQP
jgi:hypothetical protein